MLGRKIQKLKNIIQTHLIICFYNRYGDIMKNKKILGICLRLMIIILGIVVIIFYIGPLVTTGEKNLGVITGLVFAGLLFLYAIFFNKINNAIKSFCKN